MPKIFVVNGSDTTYPATGAALPAGNTFTINADFFSIIIDDDDATFDGDITTNETPDDPGQTTDIGGQDLSIYYDFTFEATVNGQTFEFASIDVDLNNDGDAGTGTLGGVDPGENLVFLAIIGPEIPDIPPGGLTFTVTTTVSENTNRPFDDFICFASGTLIQTARGDVPIETIQTEDLVSTADRGHQAVRWIGKREVVPEGPMCPVRIEAGAIGNNRDLVVSQQHRILVTNLRAGLMFDNTEMLVPAKHLVAAVPGVYLDTSYFRITYCHMLFDRHELVWSEGVLTESLHPGATALDMVGAEGRKEILSIFPELAEISVMRPMARPEMRRREFVALNKPTRAEIWPKSSSARMRPGVASETQPYAF